MVQLFDEVDYDHNGSISYKELVAVVEAHSLKVVSDNGGGADGGSEGVKVIGPAAQRREIEKPAGEKDHGSSTTLVHTPEQQAQLGVDEEIYIVDEDAGAVSHTFTRHDTTRQDPTRVRPLAPLG